MDWLDFLTNDFAKVAAETKKQRLEKAKIMPPDESDVVHRFPNGWTINRLTTNRDRYREGCLQGICWAPNNAPGGKETDPAQHPKTRELLPEILNPNVKRHHYSLRDQDNLPLVSFYRKEDESGQVHMTELEGRKNSHVKPEYVDHISSWHYHASPHAKEGKAGNVEFHTDGTHELPSPGVRDTGYGYWGEGGRANQQKYLMKTYDPKDIQHTIANPSGKYDVGDQIAITDGNKVLDAFARVTEHAPKKGIYRIQSPMFGKLEANHEEMANQTDDIIKFQRSPYEAHKPAPHQQRVDVPDALPDDWFKEGSRRWEWGVL